MLPIYSYCQLLLRIRIATTIYNALPVLYIITQKENLGSEHSLEAVFRYTYMYILAIDPHVIPY